MRRSRKEKEITHKRIVEIASRRFREKGFHGVSVADLMGEAGLTHGGFYKHFNSRDDLIAEATSSSFTAEAKDLRDAMAGTNASGVEAFIKAYLTERHLSDPGSACPTATLSTEVARTPAAQEVFELHFHRYCEWLASKMDDEGENKKMRAAAIISAAAGAFSIARSLKDKKMAIDLLDTMREMLLDIVKEK